MDECQHCGGKLICYSTRLEGDHRVRYMRCKECGQAAPKKQIPEPVPSALMQRIAKLEARLQKLEAGFFVDWDNSKPPQLWLWAGERGDETAEPVRRITPFCKREG